MHLRIAGIKPSGRIGQRLDIRAANPRTHTLT